VSRDLERPIFRGKDFDLLTSFMSMDDLFSLLRDLYTRKKRQIRRVEETGQDIVGSNLLSYATHWCQISLQMAPHVE